jgi:hypothetical protein
VQLSNVISILDLPPSCDGTTTTKNLETREIGAQQISAIAYRALAKAEMNAPVAARGEFIPAGGVLDAKPLGDIIAVAA